VVLENAINLVQLVGFCKICKDDIQTKHIYFADLIAVFTLQLILFLAPSNQLLTNEFKKYAISILLISFFTVLSITPILNKLIGQGDLLLLFPIIMKMQTIQNIGLWLNTLAIISLVQLIVLLRKSQLDSTLESTKQLEGNIAKSSVAFAPNLVLSMYIALLSTK
jgi:hypothetical protein